MALAQIQSLPLEQEQPIRSGRLAKQTRAALRLVPDFSVENSAAVSNRGFMGILIGVFVAGLLALLCINTALTSGAFTLENMKLELAAVNDQRDAVLNQVATHSSPDFLAKAATKLGMQPQTGINFLSLNPTAVPTAPRINSKAPSVGVGK